MFFSWRTDSRIWRERRKVQRQFDEQIGKATGAKVKLTPRTANDLLNQVAPLQNQLAFWDTLKLRVKAERNGVEISHRSDWWDAEPDGEGGLKRTHLNAVGRTSVANLIQEERLKKAERWIRILAPLVAALTGLLGTIIALVTILTRR